MKRTSKAVSFVGSVALAGTIMLAGCGGGSTSATSPAAATSSVSAARFDPPRPSGVRDEDWANIVRESDPSTYRERFASRTSEVNVERCRIPYASLTADDLAAEATNSVALAPGSTVEEWTAVLEYVIAAQEAYGFGTVRSELCSAVPSPAADGGSAAAVVGVKGLFQPQIY